MQLSAHGRANLCLYEHLVLLSPKSLAHHLLVFPTHVATLGIEEIHPQIIGSKEHGRIATIQYSHADSGQL